MNNKESKGVLHEDYADQRQKKPELIFRYKTRAQIVANVVKKNFKNQNLNILEIGSAESLTMLEINKLLPQSNVIGLEYAEDLIKKSPELPQNVKVVQGDAMNFPEEIKNQKFDVICALALLEHLPNPEKCIQAAHAALKPGGLFIASSPNPIWDNISVKLGLLKENQHEVDMTKEKMVNLPKTFGFSQVAFKRFMWAPISFLPYLKIKISPSNSLAIDSFIFKLKIFNWLFVNQLVVAKK